MNQTRPAWLETASPMRSPRDRRSNANCSKSGEGVGATTPYIACLDRVVRHCPGMGRQQDIHGETLENVAGERLPVPARLLFCAIAQA